MTTVLPPYLLYVALYLGVAVTGARLTQSVTSLLALSE